MAKKKLKSTANKAKDVENVKLELFIKDRMAVMGMLPAQGDLITMTLAKDIGTKTELKQEEFKQHNIRVRADGKPGLMWDIEKKGVSITFSSAEVELLKSRIAELDKKKEITEEMLEVCMLIRDRKN